MVLIDALRYSTLQRSAAQSRHIQELCIHTEFIARQKRRRSASEFRATIGGLVGMMFASQSLEAFEVVT